MKKLLLLARRSFSAGGLLIAFFAAQKMTAQSLVFAKNLGFMATDLNTAVDSSGAIFLAGTAAVGTDVDPGPLEKKLEGPTGKKVGFVCRFSPAGQLDWAVSLGDAASDVTIPFAGGDALKMGQKGRLHVAFQSFNAMKMYPGGLDAKGLVGSGGPVVVTLNAADGSLVSVFDMWTSQTNAPILPREFNDFCPLPSGKVAVCGAFRGLIHGGPNESYLYNSNPSLNGWMFVFDPSDLTKTVGASVGAANYKERFTGVGFGAGGRIVLGGEYTGTFDANPAFPAENFLNLFASQGSQDAFILVLDSTLKYQTAYDLPASSSGRYQIESAASGWSVFGPDLNQGVSELIDPQGGESNYLAHPEAEPPSTALQIEPVKNAVDGANFYQIGGKKVALNGSDRIRMNLKKSSTTGETIWQTSIDGASLNFEGTSLGASADGKTIAIVGFFDGSMDFDPSSKTNVLTAPTGEKRAFLLKFSDPCPDLRLHFLENVGVSCAEKGRVKAGATGGEAPYFFEWQTQPPVFDSVFETSTGGYFGLKMTDSTGCERRTEVFVSQPASLDPTLFDARASLFSLGEFRPGFEQVLFAAAQNPFCQSKNGELRLALDPKMTFLFADPAPDFLVADTLVWLFDSLRADISKVVKVRVRLEATAVLGDSVCVRAEVRPTDLEPKNNVFELKELIIGSFDPNDIAASPAGVCAENAVLPNQKMTYRIRFQNTGTASAINVRVLDTLPKSLDLQTLRIVSASHAMGVERPDSSVLAFVFDEIHLPDSFSNEAASHGFVIFELAQKPNLPNGERIENRAAIYFDFNAPVLTNTIFQTVRAILPTCPTVSTGDFLSEKMDFSVAPNPLGASDFLKIELEDDDFFGPFRVEILTLGGQLFSVFEKEKTTARQLFEIEKGLPNGAFFVRGFMEKCAGQKQVLRF